MELSIDFKFLSSIAFDDVRLVSEMAEEWCTDTEKKMEEIKMKSAEMSTTQFFNRLHELKTNYTMVQSPEAIKFIGSLLNQIEQKSEISANAIAQLDEISSKLIKIVKNELSTKYQLNS